VAPKFKYVVPKLKSFALIQNKQISVPLKTSRFVRGKLSALPACHPPTPSSVLVKSSNDNPLKIHKGYVEHFFPSLMTKSPEVPRPPPAPPHSPQKDMMLATKFQYLAPKCQVMSLNSNIMDKIQLK